MTSLVTLPLSTYVSQDPRASSKRLVGCFSEGLEPDADPDVKQPQEPYALRRMPGSKAVLDSGTGLAVRGMWELAGVQYAVIGDTLYQVDLNTTSLVGSFQAINDPSVTPITGAGFIRMTDNGACMVMLVPGSALAWTYCPNGGGFQVLSASFFTLAGAIDCWFVDSYIVFLAGDGTGFFNDDGRIVSGNNQITFTTAASFTREFGTDKFVGMAVDHRQVLCFGTRTSEGYANTGNPIGSPFSSAPDSFMQKGMHPLAAYSVALQDESVFWVANDKTVRRRNGQTPQKVSNSGIDQILGTVDLTGCYALTPTVYGHPLWVLTIPIAQRTIAYDCLTSKWFEISSLSTGFWRPQCYYNGFGMQLLGDSMSGQIGVVDENTFADFGDSQLCEITPQTIYYQDYRITTRRLELVVTVGAGLSATQAPTVDLFSSDNSGKVWYSYADPQDLGTQGEDEASGQRAVWWNLGQSRARNFKFRITDPSPAFAVQVNAMLEGGKY